jgi:hypothetical protein
MKDTRMSNDNNENMVFGKKINISSSGSIGMLCAVAENDNIKR